MVLNREVVNRAVELMTGLGSEFNSLLVGIYQTMKITVTWLHKIKLVRSKRTSNKTSELHNRLF